MLAKAGLRLASWTRRGFDTVSRDPQSCWQAHPRLAAGDIVLLHDGHAARAAAGAPVVLEVLPRLLEAIAAALHPVTLRERFAAPRGLPAEAARCWISPPPVSALRPLRLAFARGKLGGDPAYRAILARGLLAGTGTRAGPGLRTRACWRRCCSPRNAATASPGTGPPPGRRRRGLAAITRHRADPQQVQRARAASAGARAARPRSSRATLRVPFRAADAVVILDVLHYIEAGAQRRAVLRRVHASLPPGGLLLLRIGDAAGGCGLRSANAGTGRHAGARPAAGSACIAAAGEWRALLERLRLRHDRSIPMSDGTPFANTLLRADGPDEPLIR